MRKKDWKIKKNKKTIRQLSDMYYSNFWHAFPHWPHQCYVKCYTKSPNYSWNTLEELFYKPTIDDRDYYWKYRGDPSYPILPKVRKKHFTIRDYHWYRSCPKEWNKLMHIRPVRREWKNFCRVAARPVYTKTYCEVETYQEGIHWSMFDDMDSCVEYCQCKQFETIYAADGIPYPSHKRHIYYF